VAIKRITTNLIKDSDIATVDIANNAITAAKITDGNITTAKLADLSVTAGKLAGTLDLTGKTITVATATTGDSDTSPASTAFVQQEIAALVDSSPSSLNTLNELAAALGDDASFSTTVTNSIATKLPLAGGTMTGDLKIVNSSGATLDINSNASAADSKILLHEGTSASPANGASIRYDGVNNLFKIGVGSSVDTTRLTIVRDTGNVGIGNTPNVAFKLDVEGAVRTNGSGFYVSANYSSTNNVYKIYENSNEFRIESQIYGNANTASSPIVFATSNTDGRLARMTIDNTGNVGIGNTQATAINNASALGNLVVGSGSGAEGITIYSGSDSYGGLNFADATSGGGSYAGYIKFNHVDNSFGHFIGNTEKMRITNTGQVIISTDYNSPQLSAMSYGDWDDLPLQLRDTSLTNTAGYAVTGIGFGYNLETTAAIVVSDEGGSAAQSMSFITGTNASAVPRMTIDSSGNVGIGTTGPDYALDVYDVGEAWIRADSSTTTESTANSGLRFAHGGVNHGVLYHRGSDDALLYFDNIAASTRFLIDSSGNVGMGSTDPNSALHVVGDTLGGILLKQSAQISYTPANEANFQQGITFENSGSGHAFSIGYGQGGVLKFSYFDNTTTYSELGQFNSQGDLNIKGSVIVPSGEGISFAANSNASGRTSELLDDYEEGTWTPTFSGASLSTATGSYTKIGNQVTVHFRVITTGGLPTSTSQVQVGGLPFTIGTNFGGVGGLYVGPSNVSSATGGGGTIVPYVTGGESFIRFLNVDTGTFGYTLMGELEVTGNNVVTAIGTVTYQV
jgi:hypothetical protein